MGAQGDARNWVWNGAVNTVADLARIGSDAFRLGKGIGCALFNDRASASDKAWAVAADIGRGLTLTGAGIAARAAFRAAKGVGKAISKARPPNSAVIGRLDDLKPSNLRQGEHTLLDKLSGNLGSPKANWKRNSSVLREEMRRGIPIRDASARLKDSYVLPDGRTIRQTFLGMERNTLT